MYVTPCQAFRAEAGWQEVLWSWPLTIGCVQEFKQTACSLTTKCRDSCCPYQVVLPPSYSPAEERQPREQADGADTGDGTDLPGAVMALSLFNSRTCLLITWL